MTFSLEAILILFVLILQMILSILMLLVGIFKTITKCRASSDAPVSASNANLESI